ncbi:MAG: response regulator [Spongiibacter sp.]|uniref:Response regulator n=1 Tax=Spongiibacter thalassae TaxID=2721624 RepID=A0ABX1GDL6_9GAMM|nr:response regulator [Spongiibacter thalassae]MDX1505798.1 response regulator [Spongiibacter sp.]NKI17241.1 response regulator [Spongiibacter thalassae]
MITVLVADDHAMVRTGISRMLDDADDIQVVGEASSGEEAVLRCRELKPDIVLMDIRMPGMGGLEATRKLQQVAPETKIIAVSACEQEPIPSRLMKAGASAFLSKGSGADAGDEIIKAVRQVAKGKRYLSPAIAQALALKNYDDEVSSPFESLSEREIQISIMIGNGLRVQDIADTLHIQTKTVNSYRYRIFEKLDVAGDVALTLLAISHGLIEAPSPGQ